MSFTENSVLLIILTLTIACPVSQAIDLCNEKCSFVLRSPGETPLRKEKTANNFQEAGSISNLLPSKSFPNKISTDQNNLFNGAKELTPETDITLQNTLRAVMKYQKLKDKTQNLVEIGPRKTETSRVFFFKGIKKFMWTLFIGLQIVKTVLLAMFLPSILGSLGKMVGKVSGVNQQKETISGLNFRGTSPNLEQDSQQNVYKYSQSGMPETYETEGYGFPLDFIKPLSRLDISDHSFLFSNSSYDAVNNSKSNSYSGNNFESFLDIPASSSLLSNYDPFYSPLLSRLDAVFQQFYLQKRNEACKEKLICYMYSNPTKYAPYSNLVSAQLSRELHELQKPAISNPEILRFFKYMKAARHGQEGMDCETIYEDCIELIDMKNPVMLTAYKDINKLVQARDLGNTILH